ncbi:hypothetical protein ACFQJC_10865 [Haloferax namakaokahaiae]|uniref:DUF3592 domain-containing protein n=1 Tax=Haloferax namakaokahaiae TaxID=1748331 RepID=A0ABD5ZFN5_9EURY
MTELKHFLAFFLCGSLALAGVLSFIVYVEYDYHYSYEREVEEFPRQLFTLEYDELRPEEREVVDAAMEKNGWFNEGVVRANDSSYPPEGIEKGEHKYLFSSYRTFDWSDPPTLGSALLFVFGSLGVLAAIRADIKS